MFNNHLLGGQVIIGNITLQIVEEYIEIGQTVTANQVYEKQIRIGKEWRPFGIHTAIMSSNLLLSLRSVTCLSQLRGH